MKVIIAGSRNLSDGAAINGVVGAVRASGFQITEVFSGGARGVDEAGESWARVHQVPMRRFRPEYRFRDDRQAPLLRNQRMVDEADALIAIWDGQSRGTADVIQRAQAKGIPVYVERLQEEA